MFKLSPCFQQSGIYLLINHQVNKFYIGSSLNCYNRLHGHFNTLFAGKHHNAHLQAAFNKYGFKAFTATVIEFCHKDKITKREQYYIDLYKPIYNKNLKVDQPYYRTYNEQQREWQSADKKNKIAAGLIVVSCAKITVQWSLNGKKKIAEFRSMKQGSLAIGNKTAVQKCILKKTFVSGGYQWRLKEDLPTNLTPKPKPKKRGRKKLKGYARNIKRFVFIKSGDKYKTFRSLRYAVRQLNLKLPRVRHQIDRKGFYEDKNYYITN